MTDTNSSIFNAIRIATKDGGASMRALLNQGVDLEVRDGWGRTPLLIAVSRGDESLCRWLIDSGADVNSKGTLRYRGETALSIAASWGEDDVDAKLCRLLLSAGANVHHSQRSGWTALHYAAANSGIQTCMLLVRSGADIHAKSHDGRTFAKVASPEIRFEIERFLLAIREAEDLQKITVMATAPARAVRL